MKRSDISRNGKKDVRRSENTADGSFGNREISEDSKQNTYNGAEIADTTQDAEHNADAAKYYFGADNVDAGSENTRSNAADRADGFLGYVNGKGKLTVFAVANLLLGLSALFLLFGAFDISYISALTGDRVTAGYTVFGYFKNAAEIKLILRGVAGGWANGGYTVIGILMIFAFTVPAALAVKNLVLFFVKKSAEVRMTDAAVNIAFLTAYLGIVNMYGANMTWAHILSLAVSAILPAYSAAMMFIRNGYSGFPVFSCVALLLIPLCMFLLTACRIYSADGYYAAFSADVSGGGKFAFVMLFVTLGGLAALAVMQFKEFPDLIETVLPAVVCACAVAALTAYACGRPKYLDMSGGFVFGAVATAIVAAAYIIFSAVPALRKFNVKISDGSDSAR